MFGRHPMPFRFAACVGDELETVEQSLLQGLGSFLGDEEAEILRVKYHAIACALWEMFDTAEALSNVWNPYAMTDMLPRWESILGLGDNNSLPDYKRREAIAFKFALWNVQANRAGLHWLCQECLKDTFVRIDYTTAEDAASIGQASFPGGISDNLNGIVYPDGDFRNAACSVKIIVAKSGSVSLEEYHKRISRVRKELTSFMPSWAGFQVKEDNEDFILDQDLLDLNGF